MPEVTGSPTTPQTYGVFISYSRQDADRAKELEALLREAGIRPWLDQQSIRAGDKFPYALAQALKSSTVVAWLASLASAASVWVQRELYYAAIKLNKPIVPIFLEHAIKTEMPEDLEFFVAGTEYIDANTDGLPTAVAQLKELVQRLNPQAASEPKLIQTHGSNPVEFLPVTESSPLVIGLALDVSGTMQTAIGSRDEAQSTRLESAIRALRELASRYRPGARPEDVEAGLSLAELFAYGFGFTDAAKQWGKLVEILRRKPLPKRIFTGPVRDLLEVAGASDRTLKLRDIEAQWKQISDGLENQVVDLFGSTPMRGAMEEVESRFALEYARFAGTPHSALVIVSDGQSSDGSPVGPCLRIARRGTTILCCYLSANDVLTPKKLYAEPEPLWDAGAVDLFRCSSILQEEDSILIGALRERGWEAQEGCRLFAQANQSELVTEFVSVILELARQ